VISRPEQLPVSVAVDATAVYWINSSEPNGAVRRANKP
jgi:hypothetical protein